VLSGEASKNLGAWITLQTFLPYKDFARSAAVLDRRRLGNQRGECKAILTILAKGTGGYSRHPAVLMWKGYEGALKVYLAAIIAEWEKRGYRHETYRPDLADDPEMPPWLGDERLHASHRSNLLRKKPEHYSEFGWMEADDLPYFWPTKSEDYS